MTKISKAVFPVAGFGTRFLPATKAMPKELLPIVDKPLIQYAAEEAIAAGIDTLIFVTGRNKRAIEDHFDANNELETMLRAKGKDEQADMVRNIIPKGVECIFVRQAEQLGLGHAVLCAERAVGGDPFALLLADIFMTDHGFGATQELMAQFVETGKSQLSVVEIFGPNISNYGVIATNGSINCVSGIVEKPKASAAPSNLAAVGRYVFDPSIFGKLREVNAGVGGEIQLTDAMNKIAQQGLMGAVQFTGRHFDCGSIDGFVQANKYEYEKRLTN